MKHTGHEGSPGGQQLVRWSVAVECRSSDAHTVVVDRHTDGCITSHMGPLRTDPALPVPALLEMCVAGSLYNTHAVQPCAPPLTEFNYSFPPAHLRTSSTR